MNNTKKGFTFAELMISLVIIAVITAILYPTISELAPNNNKHLFKSAYKTIEMVISDINNDNTINVFPTTANDMCDKFSAKLNLSTNNSNSCQANNTNTPVKDKDGNVLKDDKGNDVTEVTNLKNSFQTTNGMRWYFDESADPAGVKIYIDVNASNNKTDSKDSITNSWKQGSFGGNTTIQDTFFVIVDNQGRIISIDSVGRQHLLDESEN